MGKKIIHSIIFLNFIKVSLTDDLSETEKLSQTEPQLCKCLWRITTQPYTAVRGLSVNDFTRRGREVVSLLSSHNSVYYTRFIC